MNYPLPSYMPSVIRTQDFKSIPECGGRHMIEVDIEIEKRESRPVTVIVGGRGRGKTFSTVREIQSDINSLHEFMSLGISKTQAHNVFLEVFGRTGNKERYETIKIYINDFDNNVINSIR